MNCCIKPVDPTLPFPARRSPTPLKLVLRVFSRVVLSTLRVPSRFVVIPIELRLLIPSVLLLESAEPDIIDWRSFFRLFIVGSPIKIWLNWASVGSDAVAGLADELVALEAAV